MATMYNPHDENYLDELSVRQEISRVFDVCATCRKCVDACGVFPRLVASVDQCSHGDAGLLTPLQQDEILDACHLCMQCVVQCPYADTVTAIAPQETDDAVAVQFPHLVLRHRAMSWSRGSITFRQRYVAVVLSYIPVIVRIFHIARPVFEKFIARYGWHPSNISIQRRRSRGRDLRNTDASHRTDDAVLFPTCVVEQYQPQLVDDFLALCGVVDRQVSCAESFVCCGAPALFSGNLARFRRIARKNLAAMARRGLKQRTIVVGQSMCLCVMKEFYPTVGRREDDPHLMDGLVGMTEYFAHSYASLPTSDRPQCTDELSVIALESSVDKRATQGNKSPTDSIRDVYEFCDIDVAVVEHSSFVETVWSAQSQFNDAIRDTSHRLVSRIEALDDADSSVVIVGESCLTNAYVQEHTGRPITHPISVLASRLTPR